MEERWAGKRTDVEGRHPRWRPACRGVGCRVAIRAVRRDMARGHRVGEFWAHSDGGTGLRGPCTPLTFCDIGHDTGSLWPGLFGRHADSAGDPTENSAPFGVAACGIPGGYGYPSSDVNSGVGLVPNSNGRYHGGMTRIRTLNGIPTQTQRACPARAPTSTQRLDLNTKCPPVPVFALLTPTAWKCGWWGSRHEGFDSLSLRVSLSR